MVDTLIDELSIGIDQAPRLFEGRFSNNDVEQVANFIDTSGWGELDDIFEVIPRGEGWSLGLSQSAISKLNLGENFDSGRPVFLRMFAVGQSNLPNNLIVYQEGGDSEQVQQKIVGMVDKDGSFSPLSTNLVEYQGRNVWQLVE